MNNKSLLVVVFLTINGLDSGVNKVDAGAHELVPFSNGWFGSVEKSRQVEETAVLANNEELAEYNIRPRKMKHREVKRKKTEENLKKSHETAKKKMKKKRKRKKKPVPNPRRFVKTPNVDRDKESNMTDSIEVTNRSKPVDIIVHIKVSE